MLLLVALLVFRDGFGGEDAFEGLMDVFAAFLGGSLPGTSSSSRLMPFLVSSFGTGRGALSSVPL